MFRKWFLFGAMLTALLTGGCGSRRAVSPTTEPADGGGQPAGDCPPGRVKCDDSCVNLSWDQFNCGACGKWCGELCDGKFIQYVCKEGKCPRTSCPAAGEMRCCDICVDPATDNDNCGSCGTSCDTANGFGCQNGKCSCFSGLTDCGVVCVKTASDPSNCGSCGTTCSPGMICVAGQCTCGCPPGFVCQNGACACPNGLTDCSGTCVDLMWNPSHCGACYASCPPAFVCQGGGCTCPGSLTECYGTCIDLTSDLANCGKCGNACSWGQPCVSGVCSAAPVSCQSKQWQNHVYLFCQAAVSWADASAACKAAGKHLVTINDAAENTWVYNETLAGTGWWWIGFNDLKTEGQWVWEDGTPVGYTNWEQSEPNDLGGEDCANLGFYQAALWNDQSCSEPGSYICESPLVCPAVCNGVCVDLQYDNNNCGACGAKCDTTSGFQCQWGKCACAGGLTDCLGKCVDLSSDPTNCGSCNATCAAGFVCQNGACSKSSWSGLQLNGSATLVGGVLSLTPAQYGQNGSAFTVTPIPITSATSLFSHFRFRMHGGSGADGLTFVLQNDPRGSLALATGQGGDLAYAHTDAISGGTQIVNSLAVEFDTWTNGASVWCDLDDNHVGIGTNGTFVCTTQSVPFDLDSGSPVYAWVEYTPGVLNVYLSTTPVKPPAPMLSHNVDLMALVGKQAFVGFTGATGGITNFHDIEAWTFSSAP